MTRTHDSRSATPGRRPPLRRLAAWLGIWALALHGLVPLGQGVAAPSDAPWAAPYLVICTALGFQRVPNPDRPAEPDGRFACPVCQVHALGDDVVPTGAVLATAGEAAPGPRLRAPEDAGAASATVSLVRARGPPLG